MAKNYKNEWNAEIDIDRFVNIMIDEKGKLIDIPELLNVSLEDLYALNESNYLEWIEKVQKKVMQLKESTQKLEAVLLENISELEKEEVRKLINENQKLKNDYFKAQFIFQYSKLYYMYIRKYIAAKRAEKMPKQEETTKPEKIIPMTKKVNQRNEEMNLEPPKEEILNWMPIGLGNTIPLKQPSKIVIDEKEELKKHINILEAKKTLLEEQIFPNLAAVNKAISEVKNQLYNHPLDKELRSNLELVTTVKAAYINQNRTKLLQNAEYRETVMKLNFLKSKLIFTSKVDKMNNEKPLLAEQKVL